MNDTIKMAREAGLGPTTVNVWLAYLERFAALVRADEREQCAKVCEDEGQRIDASWQSCAAAIRDRT